MLETPPPPIRLINGGGDDTVREKAFHRFRKRRNTGSISYRCSRTGESLLEAELCDDLLLLKAEINYPYHMRYV